MRTSATGFEPISDGTMGFISARNRQQAFNLLVSEFKKSGLTERQLAAKTKMAPEVISRILKRPRNLEFDTFSKLIYGICGSAISLSKSFPATSLSSRHAIEYSGGITSVKSQRERWTVETSLGALQKRDGLFGLLTNPSNSNEKQPSSRLNATK